MDYWVPIEHYIYLMLSIVTCKMCKREISYLQKLVYSVNGDMYPDTFTLNALIKSEYKCSTKIKF